jgi:hypothetical protein
MKTRLAAASILLLAGTPALPHRLDEYLEATLISVEKNQVHIQIVLTPGVAVFPAVMAKIDSNGDGAISEAERSAYAERVLRDVSLVIDGHRLTPQLLSLQFPTIDDMKEGRGEIQLEFNADLPRGGPNRRLIFENYHQSRIAAYQVNCLVPRDPDIRVLAQNRNYSQSHYELEYAQAGVGSGPLSFAWWSSDLGWLSTLALFLFARFALRSRQRAQVANSVRGR